MKVAALDLGSNTSLLLIADVEHGKIKEVLADESEVTRLGQDLLKSKRFHPEALARMQECFSRYRKIIDKIGVSKTLAVATSAARDAQNKQEFLSLAEQFGIPIKIISGEKEAEVTFVGSTFDVDNQDSLAVIDVGGGSTEIIAKGPSEIKGKSLDIGSVRLTEMFITQHPIAKSELDQLENYVRNVLEKNADELPSPSSVESVIAVAGTPTTLAMIEQGIRFREERVHKFPLPIDKIEEWINKLAKMTVEERQALIGMHPKRADVIVAGAIILKATAQFLKANPVIVSTKGVRYGVALLMDHI